MSRLDKRILSAALAAVPTEQEILSVLGKPKSQLTEEDRKPLEDLAARVEQMNAALGFTSPGELRLQPTNRKHGNVPPSPGQGEGGDEGRSAAVDRAPAENELRLQPTNPRRKPGRPPRIALSDQQHAAVDQVALGLPDRAVAEKVRVHRMTITKWRLYHVLFRAEVAARREELWAADRARFRHMFQMAMHVLTQQMQSTYAPTSCRAAKAVMMMASRFMPQEQADSSDPDQILIQHARHIKRCNASKDPGQQSVEEFEIEMAEEDLERKLNEPVEEDGDCWCSASPPSTGERSQKEEASPPGTGEASKAAAA